MIKRIFGKNYDVYAFDFETHNDQESIKNDTSGVWLGVIANENSSKYDEETYFYSVREFIVKLNKLSSKKRHHHNDNRPCNNLLLYAYNLSFEWSFILPVLKEMGYSWSETINDDSDSKTYNSVTTRSCSSVWSVTIKLENGQQVLIRDLAKIYSGGLGKLAESMGLETQKGEIEYTKNRLHNYIIPFHEKEYCYNDVRIVVEVLLKVFDDKQFWTSSSISTYACKNMINSGYSKVKYKMKAFRKDYPKMDPLEYNFVRKTVAGGITYAPEHFQFRNVRNVKHLDAHQMHPTQGYIHMFPYGPGTYGVGKPKNTFARIYACRIRVSYTGVKLHSVIKCIGVNSITNATLFVWSFEIPTMKKCYENLKIEYIDYYEYKTKFLPWRSFYKYNNDKRSIARKNCDNYNVIRYKLLNNSSYGKLLEKAHLESFENVIDTRGVITSKTHTKEDKEDLGAKYTCLQVGSCIPAYSRVQLIETALTFGYKNIVYFDTDSIFYLDNEETRKAVENVKLGDDLGTWAFEEDIKVMQVTAPKRYKMEFTHPNKKGITKVVKMAGVNRVDTDVPYEEINITNKEYEVQRAYRCRGGTLIKLQKKTIGVQKKYDKAFKENTL